MEIFPLFPTKLITFDFLNADENPTPKHHIAKCCPNYINGLELTRLQNSTLNSIILYLFMGKELLSIGDSLSYYLLKIKAWLGEQKLMIFFLFEEDV